jgi:hypothetical protein
MRALITVKRGTKGLNVRPRCIGTAWSLPSGAILILILIAYCAVDMAEDFDAMEVCCETVVTCVESEICNCLFSGFVLLFSHVDLMFCDCVLLDEVMASWENFSCRQGDISYGIASKCLAGKGRANRGDWKRGLGVHLLGR